jgi:streptomycin 3"-adenylyltransferase
MRYEFPKTVPRSVKEFLGEKLSILHSILLDNLVGIYLYGSLAMGCFNPKTSDIDVILVVKERISREKSRRIIQYLKGTCSNERRLELSIIGADIVQNPTYPIIVYLHYEYWGNIFENEEDNEILSNLYTTKKRGFRIWGAPISDIFSKIPAKYHLRSVVEDIQHTRILLHESQEHVGYNIVVYWVLGSCRVLAFIREGIVLSKIEGGLWGLANLPEKYHDLFDQALSCYQGKKKDHFWNKKELDAFAEYMSDTILRESRLRENLS